MKLPFLKPNRPTLEIMAALLVAALTAAPAFAEEATIRYQAKPGSSSCQIEGTSSIHDWTMETSIISGSMEVDPGFPESALTNPAAAKPKSVVNLPVRTFKSGKDAMDDKMQLTMSVTNYSKVEYRLIELKPKSKPGTTGPIQFDAVGALTIVGKTVTNTMPVTIEKKDGLLKVTGAAPIKMSDFGIAPPRINVPLFPDITVGDDLKITFSWQLSPKAKTQ